MRLLAIHNLKLLLLIHILWWRLCLWVALLHILHHLLRLSLHVGLGISHRLLWHNLISLIYLRRLVRLTCVKIIDVWWCHVRILLPGLWLLKLLLLSNFWLLPIVIWIIISLLSLREQPKLGFRSEILRILWSLLELFTPTVLKLNFFLANHSQSSFTHVVSLLLLLLWWHVPLILWNITKVDFLRSRLILVPESILCRRPTRWRGSITTMVWVLLLLHF